jgi:hypothetical protein
MQTAKRGALGGASNEAGANHRAGVAALLATYGLLGEPVPWLRSDACPVLVRMEADLHVDDVVVDLADGTRAFMQAKLTAGGKAFEDTVDQWCRSVTSGECRPGDELLFVVARSTKTFEGLSDALAARRSGASLTTSAAKHITKLRQLAATHALAEPATQRLLDAAAIRVLDARDNGPDEALGSACLNAAVVPAGHGQAAFRALRAASRAQAEQRTASDLAVWRGWLTTAQLPLIADAAGTAAARLEAQDQAVRLYREQWAGRQDVLPLADLGLGLTSMTVPGMTTDLRATAPGQKTGRDRLADTVRRQGRLFLVGRPGAGKTVASRAIAARWAANERAPVPVWLRLRDLIPLLPTAGPYRLDVRDLLQVAVSDAQPPLKEALLARIEQGHALLVLDALDETLERRDAVVEAVADLLDGLPEELDVLVTSRHSCLRSATLLHLPVHELQAPRHLDDTLDQLLSVVGRQLGGPAGTAQWMAERRARLTHSRRAEPDLWRVPLLATLMALLIAQQPTHALPAGRAALLQEVIDASVRLWEMRRATTAPDTALEVTADILIDCFDDIARLLAVDGSTPWQHAHDAVNTRLQQHWGKPAGTAAAAARHILEYWDTTAGLFLTDGPHGILTARTRLFAEIGEARWATRTPADLTTWMNETIAQRPDSARLAASLSPAAARALIARALDSRGELLDLVHAAMKDGAVFDETALHAYRQAQLDRMETTPEHYPPAPHHVALDLDLDEKRSPRAELIVRLAGEDLDAAQTDQLIAAAAAISRRLRAVTVALRIQQQATRRGTGLTDNELDVLQEALEALAEDEAEHDPGRIHGSDDLVRVVVTHLLPRRPETASAVAEICSDITLDTLEWLENELPRTGHATVLKAIRHLTTPDALSWIRQSANALPALFELLTELEDTPVELTPNQSWHLDEAAAYINALAVKHFAAMTPPAAARQQPELTRRILRLAFDASGYDGPLVSAQLRSLKQENPERPDWGLLYLPSARTPATTPTAVDLDNDLIVRTLQYGNAWLVALTLALADQSPSTNSHLADRLTEELPGLNARTRMQTARFLARRWPSLALPDDDPVVGAGAGQAKATAYANSHRHRDLHPLLADPDLLVRSQAARCLHDIPSADLPALEQALVRPAQQWTCLDCDATVPAESDDCGRNHPRPTPHLTP